MRENFWWFLWRHVPVEDDHPLEQFLRRRYFDAHWRTYPRSYTADPEAYIGYNLRAVDLTTNDTGIEDPYLKNLSR